MKTAIIGLGVIGKVHAAVLSAEKKSIVALCDVDAAAAEGVKQSTAPNATVYTDWKKMLDETTPDAVHICTPHYLHAEMTVECLKRGIHVLCEKPLCITKEQLKAVLAAERASSATLGVCHQNRYLPTNLYVKKLLEGKKVVSAHGDVIWSRGKSYYDTAAWRGTLSMEGGGVLINQALHTFDLMAWMLGLPSEITASVSNLTLQGEIEVEDTASVVAYGENGFTFFATNASACDMPVEMRFVLSDGTLVRVNPNEVTVGGTVVLHSEMERALGKACYGNGHTPLIADFYDCIESGRPFPVNGEEGAGVVRMILAAYQSKGEKVPV